MSLSRIVAIFGVCAGAALGGPSRAEAVTVFSNYNGIDCTCGEIFPSIYAVEFNSAATYDFTGAAAYVLNFDVHGNAQPFSLSLYSATAASSPGALLWTSGTLFGPGPTFTATLVSTTYAGPPIVVQQGTEYFFAVNLLSSGSLVWLGGGIAVLPLFSSTDGTSWTSLFNNPLQFQVYGAPVVPESPAWAMMLIGFAGLALAGRRAAKPKALAAA
jgi:hypothetical protein